ncbi:MAG TPA: hypothetical protein PLP37_07305 [Clostridiales bacterium]|nr:hypothetical protein [Clostridiales bacterium]
MKRTALLILFYIISSFAAYPFTVPYFDEEFFLYPFLNYDQQSEWKTAREGNLYSGSFVQTSHGSLTTWLLMSKEEAVINKDIGRGFSFRFRYHKDTGRLLSYEKKSAEAGFGYNVNNYVKITADAGLSEQKSEADFRPGVLFTFGNSYAYAGLEFEDIIFDEKNMGGGKNNNLPLNLRTDIRLTLNRLYFFMTGSYGTGIDRTWPDNWTATDRTMQKTAVKELYTRTEFDISGSLKIYQENFFSGFEDARKLTGTAVWDTLSGTWKISEQEISEYDFKASTFNIRLGGVWAFDEKNSVESGVSYARAKHEFDLIGGQALENGHAKSYTIDYPALLPYIIYRYRILQNLTAETAYMGSYTIEENKDNFYYVGPGEDYWDKDLIKLGLEYRFSPNASLYISAGQLINTGVFGGGNARVNIFF